MSKTTKIIAGLGVAALAVAVVPAAVTYADCTNNTTTHECTATYSVSVNETLTLAYTAGTGNAASVANGAYKDDLDGGTLTATTNYVGGYTIKVKSSTASSALTGTNGTIPAGTSLAGSASNWALKASGTDAVATSWFAVVGSGSEATLVAQSSSPTSTSGTATTITYGVSVASNQPAGSYSNTVTYTMAKKTS